MNSSKLELEKAFNKHFTEFLKHIGLDSLVAHYMDNDDNFGERFRAAILDLVEQEIAKAYAQGLNDALFRPDEHTPPEIYERNLRIGRHQTSKLSGGK